MDKGVGLAYTSSNFTNVIFTYVTVVSEKGGGGGANAPNFSERGALPPPPPLLRSVMKGQIECLRQSTKEEVNDKAAKQ